MYIPTQCITYLENADGKAFATYGADGVNVVPVSTIKVSQDCIVLVDYFMSKTRSNLKVNNTVSLAAWIGFAGCQIKGTAFYESEGIDFEAIIAWDAKLHPDREIKGIIKITPTKIYDLSAGPNAGVLIS